MERVSKLPWGIAEEGNRIANGALGFLYRTFPSLVMVSCVVPLKYFYVSIISILVAGFAFKEMRLLKKHENNEWRKVLFIIIAATLCATIYKLLTFYFGPLFDNQEIEIFVPAIFAVLICLVNTGRFSNKVELSYYKSKGYEYTGRLGGSDEPYL